MAKTNNLTLILAKKGSGKSTLAQALAHSQNKPLFMISPNVESLAKWQIDKVNNVELDLDSMQKVQYSHIFYVQKDDFNELLSDLIELKEVCILIDELDFYLKSKADNETAFFKFINYGRHKQNDLIAVTRRMQDIPKTLTSQMDTLFIGKCGFDINDKKYLSAYLPEALCENLNELELGEFYKIDLINNKITYFKVPFEISKILERRLNKCES